jgi:hypothetical protein
MRRIRAFANLNFRVVHICICWPRYGSRACGNIHQAPAPEPFAYLKDVSERMSCGHPMSRLEDLLP